jgi:hypothetical protein
MHMTRHCNVVLLIRPFIMGLNDFLHAAEAGSGYHGVECSVDWFLLSS